MEILKTSLASFRDRVENNSLGIVLGLVAANLFIKFGVGLLFGMILLAFAVSFVYDHFFK